MNLKYINEIHSGIYFLDRNSLKKLHIILSLTKIYNFKFNLEYYSHTFERYRKQGCTFIWELCMTAMLALSCTCAWMYRGCGILAQESHSPVLFGAYKFNVCYRYSSKITAPWPQVAQANQLLLRRHHGLHTCIPGLEGTLHEGIKSEYLNTKFNYDKIRNF